MNKQPVSQPMPEIAGSLGIRLGDSVGILGMRGTGKTYLAKRLYASLAGAGEEMASYVIDSNQGGDFTGWRGRFAGFPCPLIRAGQLVWQPPADMSPDWYEDFFARLYAARRAAVVLLDEGNALGKGPHFYFSQLLKRGRARPHFPGITVVSLWQELAQRADTPRQVFSQVTHLIRFYVAHPYDLGEVNRRMNLPSRVQPEHTHGFWHVRMDVAPLRPVYHANVRSLERGSPYG